MNRKTYPPSVSSTEPGLFTRADAAHCLVVPLGSFQGRAVGRQDEDLATLPLDASAPEAGPAAGPAPLARAKPWPPETPVTRPEASAEGADSREVLPQVLTADELAALLRINRKTVYAGFKAGEIPGGKRIGGTIRFSRDAVLRWLAEGQVSRSSRGV